MQSRKKSRKKGKKKEERKNSHIQILYKSFKWQKIEGGTTCYNHSFIHSLIGGNKWGEWQKKSQEIEEKVKKSKEKIGRRKRKNCEKEERKVSRKGKRKKYFHELVPKNIFSFHFKCKWIREYQFFIS